VRAERTALGREAVLGKKLGEVSLKRPERRDVAREVNPQDPRRARAAEVPGGTQPQDSWVTVHRRLTPDPLELWQARFGQLPEEGERYVQQRVIDPPILLTLVVRSQPPETRLDLGGKLDGEKEPHITGTRETTARRSTFPLPVRA
jgi:hypothetical protein